MVLDTSALIAVLTGEPEQAALLDAMASTPRILISTATLLERTIVLESRLGEPAGRELDLFLHRAGAQVVAVNADQAELARRAWRRFGQGRHPVGLNYGDLCSYALAQATGEPRLYRGNDFSLTDIQGN